MRGCDAVPANFRDGDPAPHCECCREDIPCFPDTWLPPEAWAVAGRAGVQADRDLHAILPRHYDPLYHRIVERHDGWLAVLMV